MSHFSTLDKVFDAKKEDLLNTFRNEDLVDSFMNDLESLRDKILSGKRI